MKKLLLFTLFMFVGFVIIGCERTEDVLSENDGVYDSHYDRLYHRGKTVDVTDFDYTLNTTTEPDYADDDRELIDTSGLSDDDIINIPSESFEQAIRDYYEFEGDITFDDVRYIEELNLWNRDIYSTARIEFFVSLESLMLMNNYGLTSINGVQALSNLDTLSIDETLVKNIDYHLPALTVLDARYTMIDLDSENFLDMVRTNFPSLRYLYIPSTPTVLDRAMYDAVETLSEERFFMLSVNPEQVNYNELSHEDFIILDEDGAIEWYHRNIINFYIETSDSDQTYGPMITRFFDVHDTNESETLMTLLNEWETTIGAHNADSELAKLLIIYDYFINTNTIDEDGSDFIVDALDKEAVNLETAYKTLAIVLNHHGFTAYTDQIPQLLWAHNHL